MHVYYFYRRLLVFRMHSQYDICVICVICVYIHQYSVVVQIYYIASLAGCVYVLER